MPGRSAHATRPPGPWRLDQPPPRGNRLAVKHGAWCESIVEEKAEAVRHALLDVAPWCDEDAYAPAVSRFLRAEARALLLHGYAERIADEKGEAAVRRHAPRSTSAKVPRLDARAATTHLVWMPT